MTKYLMERLKGGSIYFGFQSLTAEYMVAAAYGGWEHKVLHSMAHQESETPGTRDWAVAFKVLPLVTHFCHLGPISESPTASLNSARLENKRTMCESVGTAPFGRVQQCKEVVTLSIYI